MPASNDMPVVARDYSTVYAGTRTTLFTTTISLTSSQASATINYPVPSITEPLSSVAYILPTPNSLLPPQTKIFLSILVRTTVFAIAERSGIPASTHSLVRELWASESLVFDVSGEPGDGTLIRGCVGWECWNTAERAGLIAGVCSVVVIIFITCCWSIFYRLGYCRRKRNKGKRIIIRDKDIGKNLINHSSGDHLIAVTPRNFKSRVHRASEDTAYDIAADNIEYGGIQMGDFAGIARPVAAHPSVPTIYIVAPTIPIINFVSLSPGQDSRCVNFEDDQDSDNPEHIPATYNHPRRYSHRYKSARYPVLEGYMDLPDAKFSTDAVVGHGVSSPEDSEEHSEHYDTQHTMEYVRTISNVSTIVEETLNHAEYPGQFGAEVDENPHARAREYISQVSEDDAHTKAAKLTRKDRKKLFPAAEERTNEKVRNYLKNLRNDPNVSKTAKVASKAAEKLVPLVEEQMHKRVSGNAEHTTNDRRKKHRHHRDSGSKRHHRRYKDDHRHKSRGRKDKRFHKHRGSKQKKKSKLSTILPLVLEIIHELWEPKGIWTDLFPKQHGDDSEWSNEGSGDGCVATARNTPAATYTAPNEVPQAPAPQPDHLISPPPRRSGRSHRPHPSTPDSYDPGPPRPNKPVRAETYYARDKKPAKYTFTGETITAPGVANNNEESSAIGAARGQAETSHLPEQEDVGHSTDEDRNERRRSRRHAVRRQDSRRGR